MNIVSYANNKCPLADIRTVGALIRRASEEGWRETAFIGKCGDGPDSALYFISYEHVTLASEPYHTWSSMHCSLRIDRFVDVEITVVEKHGC